MPYPLALAITLVVEVPIYLLVLWTPVGFRPGLTRVGAKPWWWGVLAAVGVNLASHPLVWLALSAHPGPGWFVAAELVAVVGEALLLRLWVGRDLPLLLLTATVANAASIGAGAIVISLCGPTHPVT